MCRGLHRLRLAFEQDVEAVDARQLPVDDVGRPVQRVILSEEVDVVRIDPQPAQTEQADRHQHARDEDHALRVTHRKVRNTLHRPEELCALRSHRRGWFEHREQRRNQHERHDEIDHHADRRADSKSADRDDVGRKRRQVESRRRTGAEQRCE